MAPPQYRFSGFDDNILSKYARGATTREIKGQLTEIYAIEVLPCCHRIETGGMTGLETIAHQKRCADRGC